LRKKIEKNPANPEYIVNEPGIGYRFRGSTGVASRFAQMAPCSEPSSRVPCADFTEPDTIGIGATIAGDFRHSTLL
jgi:hypothetical protein